MIPLPLCPAEGGVAHSEKQPCRWSRDLVVVRRPRPTAGPTEVVG